MPILAECGAGWVGAFPLLRHGAGYRVSGVNDVRAIRRPDVLLASADRWFRPSDVAVAPDGSLFVADFYNHIAGGRDLNQPMRGRIYRLIPKGHDGSYRVPPLELTTPAGLIEALGSPNQARRARAILHIRELGPKALPLLTPHAQSADRILRARVLFQLGLLGGEGQKHVRAALADADADIRIVALRSLRQNGIDMVPVAQALFKDPSPQVRRELMLSLREASSMAARDVLVALANQYDGQDRYYLEAVAIACRGQEAAFTRALLQSWSRDEWNRRIAGLLWVLGPPEALPTFVSIALDSKREPAARLIAVEALGGLNDPKAGSTLARLLAGEPPPELVRPTLAFLARKIPGPWRSLAKGADGARLADIALGLAKNPQLHPESLALSRTLGTRPLVQWMLSQPLPSSKRKSDRPEQAAAPEQGRDWARARLNADAVIDVAAQRSPRTAVAAYAATLINARESFATRLWLGSSAGIKVWLNGKLLHERSGERSLSARQDSVPVTLRAGLNRLLVRVEAGGRNWDYIVEIEDPLGRALEVTDQSLPKISAPASERIDPKKLPPDRELLALKGDAERGRRVFLRTKANCASCHRVKDEGGATGIGPALDGLGVKMSREAILAEILRPSQSIGQQYYVWNIQTKDGKTTAGIIIEEQPDRLTLKDAQGKATTLRKQDIEERTRSEVSLMPELLAGEFTRQELADLLQFLAELR
jgi:putative heme-binding domain-containing protein